MFDKFIFALKVGNKGFNGEAGFEELRKETKLTSDLFKEVSAVLNDRAEMEINYSRGLQKLSARLDKATKVSNAVIDNAWKLVSEAFLKEANVHHGLGVALRDELSGPLKAACESQLKTRKYVENIVDRSMRKLTDKRSETLKYKAKTHARTLNLEQAHRQCDALAKKGRSASGELAKLGAKRQKLDESVVKNEMRYLEASLAAEKLRADLEVAYMHAAGRLEALEQQRLAQMQAALGSYQRRILQLNPNFRQPQTPPADAAAAESADEVNDPTQNSDGTQQPPALAAAVSPSSDERLEAAVTADIEADLMSIVAANRPKEPGFKYIVLCDYPAEDLTNSMENARRREALVRHLAMVNKQLERESQSKQGLEYLSTVYEREPVYETDDGTKTSVHSRLRDTQCLLTFLDYHVSKLRTAIDSLDNNTNETHNHPLAAYEERVRDKVALKQTVLRIPMEQSAVSGAVDGSTRQERAIYTPASLPPLPPGGGRHYGTLSRATAATFDRFRSLSRASTSVYSTYSRRWAPIALSRSSRASSTSLVASPRLSGARRTPGTIGTAGGAAAAGGPDAHYASIDDEQRAADAERTDIAVALYDFVPLRDDELPFKKGDKIKIESKLSADWWQGAVLGDGGGHRKGLLPTNYIRVM